VLARRRRRTEQLKPGDGTEIRQPRDQKRDGRRVERGHRHKPREIEGVARPRDDGPGNGTVRTAVEVVTQRDQTVVSCEMTSLLR